MTARLSALIAAVLAAASGAGPAAAQPHRGRDLVIGIPPAAPPGMRSAKIAPTLAPALALKADFRGLDPRGRPVVRTTEETPPDVLDDGPHLLGITEIDLGPPGYQPVEELLIVYKGTRPEKIAGLLVERAFEPRRMIVVRRKGGFPWRVLQDLSDDDQVESVEPNFRLASTPVPDADEGEPNDPYFVPDRQWGLRTIEVEKAWKRTNSSRIIVAVLDSGVDYEHPDLAENIWVNEQETDDGTDEDGNGFVDDVHGPDFVDGDGAPLDSIGHGTHIAGIIGAVGNNALGIVGVNWSVKIMPVRVFSSSEETVPLDQVIKAIDYAVKKGARVINMSWVTPTHSPDLLNAIAGAGDVLMVAAADNGGDDLVGDDITTSPLYPASYAAPPFSLDNVISVMATDERNQPAGFSNYSQTAVHLAAPGSPIFSTFSGGTFASKSGTSMAAAYVSGAAALLWSIDAYEDCPPKQIRQLMVDHVASTAELADKCASGGILSLFFLKFDLEPCDALP